MYPHTHKFISAHCQELRCKKLRELLSIGHGGGSGGGCAQITNHDSNSSISIIKDTNISNMT